MLSDLPALEAHGPKSLAGVHGKMPVDAGTVDNLVRASKEAPDEMGRSRHAQRCVATFRLAPTPNPSEPMPVFKAIKTAVTPAPDIR